MADKKPKLYSGITPRGIANYPRLNTPDTKFNANGVYSTKLKIAGEDATPLMEAIEAQAAAALVAAREDLEAKLAEAKPADKPKVKKALDKLDAGPLPFAPVYDEDGNETGDVEFSFKTNATYKDKKTGDIVEKTVSMFDSKGKKLEGKKKPNVWGGSTLKIDFTASPYYNAATGSAGVSLRINAVQIIELVSSGSGGGRFGVEDGGYEAGEDEEDSPFQDEQGSQSSDDSTDDTDF